MISTSQNAGSWRVGTRGGDPRPQRRCGFRNAAAPSVSNGYNPMKGRRRWLARARERSTTPTVVARGATRRSSTTSRRTSTGASGVAARECLTSADGIRRLHQDRFVVVGSSQTQRTGLGLPPERAAEPVMLMPKVARATPGNGRGPQPLCRDGGCGCHRRWMRQRPRPRSQAISRPIRSTAVKLQNTVLSGKTTGAMDHSPSVLVSCARRSLVDIPSSAATGRSVMCPWRWAASRSRSRRVGMRGWEASATRAA